MNDQSSRFSLLEVDGPDGRPTLPAIPSKVPAPTPAPLVRQEGEGTGRAGEIDSEGRARAIAVAAVAAAVGLKAGEDTLYAWGTRGQWGEAAYKARQELSARPLLRDFAPQVRELVRGEARHQEVVRLPDLTYGEDDRIRKSTGSQGCPVTPHAFRQLLARADAPGHAAGYLGHPSLPGALRAGHVNHWLARAYEVGGRGAASATERRKVEAVALSKLDRGGRHVYGVVSDKYARYDLDRVVADAVGGCPATTRGSLKYDPTSTRWSADLAIGAEFEPVVGDVHRVAVRVSGHDAGGGSISVRLFAERVRCLNFSQVQLSGKVRGRIRHQGSDVGSQVRALLAVQGEALQAFADVWREANESAIVDGVDKAGGDARHVFRALIAAGYVDAPEGQDVAVERYFNAWLKEPGQTRAAYVNAVTRAAHEAPWSSPWVTEALEEQAGELLYNRVVLSGRQLEAVG